MTDLTPAHRSRVIAILEASDLAPEITQHVGELLDAGDPTARRIASLEAALARSVDGLTGSVGQLRESIATSDAELRTTIGTELRSWRLQLLVLVGLAMIINAGMVGIGISYGIGSTRIESTPARTSTTSGEDTDDGASRAEAPLSILDASPEVD